MDSQGAVAQGTTDLVDTRMVFQFARVQLKPLYVSSSPKEGLASAKLTVEARAWPVDFERANAPPLALLSLASRSTCRWFLELTYCGDVLAQVRSIPATDGERSTHPLILDLGSSSRSRVKHTSIMPERYALEILIGYYCRSHEDLLAEGKFVFAGVVHGGIQFYWALNVSGAEGGQEGERSCAGVRASHWGHVQLRGTSADGEHQPWVGPSVYVHRRPKRLVSHRAKCGRSDGARQVDVATSTRRVKKLHDEIDDILLTILHYSGEIRSYWEQDTPALFPRVRP